MIIIPDLNGFSGITYESKLWAVGKMKGVKQETGGVKMITPGECEALIDGMEARLGERNKGDN